MEHAAGRSGDAGGGDGAAAIVMGALGAAAGAMIGPFEAPGWLYEQLTSRAREHVGRPIAESGDDIALRKEAPRLEEVAKRLQEMLSLGNPGRNLHVEVVPINAFPDDGAPHGGERQPMLLV